MKGATGNQFRQALQATDPIGSNSIVGDALRRLATNTDSPSFLHRIFSRGLPSPNQLIFAWRGRLSTIRANVEARTDCIPAAMSRLLSHRILRMD